MSLLPTVHGRGTTAAKPAAAAANEGYLYFDTDLDKLQRSNGSAWQDVERADPAAAAGTIRQVVRAQITVDETTTLATLQNSTLSATITPQVATSHLLIRVDGSVQAHRVAGTIAERLVDVAIYNSTDAVLVAQQTRGLNLVATSSVSAAIVEPIGLYGEYTVSSTAARTFVLQYRTQTVTNVQCTIRGTETGGVRMTIMELSA